MKTLKTKGTDILIGRKYKDHPFAIMEKGNQKA